MNKKVRKLTEGAMMIALIGMVLLIDRQFAGNLIPLLNFLVPLPLVYFCVKYGVQDGFWVMVSVFLLTFVLGNPTIIFMVISGLILGFIYGSGIHKNVAPGKLFLRVVFASIIVNVIDIYFVSSLFGIDPSQSLKTLEGQILQIMNEFQMTLPPNINISDFIRQIFYFSIVFMGILQAYVLRVFSYLLLRRLSIQIPAPEPLSKYQPMKWTGYFAMAIFLLFVFSQQFGWFSESITTYMYSFAMLAQLYMAFFGWVLAAIFMEQRTGRVNPMGKLVLMFFVLTATIVFSMLGFLYITTDLRIRILGGDFGAEKKR